MHGAIPQEEPGDLTHNLPQLVALLGGEITRGVLPSPTAGILVVNEVLRRVDELVAQAHGVPHGRAAAVSLDQFGVGLLLVLGGLLVQVTGQR